jgi:hypothetical protein
MSLGIARDIAKSGTTGEAPLTRSPFKHRRVFALSHFQCEYDNGYEDYRVEF